MAGRFQRHGDTLLALVLVAVFTVFLVVLGTKADPSFDASYNLLSYQNLLNGKGFIYDYDGRSVPFDPTISTGPELYLPVFLIWKVLGVSDYYVAVYVLAAYYALFLCFLLFVVFREGKGRVMAVLVFMALFLCNQKLFQHLVFVPLGELVVCFFIFAGLYFLSRRQMVWGGLLLGLALDLKTNIAVGLLPAIGLFLAKDFLMPAIKARSPRAVAAEILHSAIVLALVITPYLIHTKMVPMLVLSPQKYSELSVAQKERSVLMQERGFGQLIDLRKNFNREGLQRFGGRIIEKASTLQGWFIAPWLPVVAALLLVVLLPLSYREGHYSFYLFVYSAVTVLWWFAGPVDAWYRYLYPAEWSMALGIVALIPLFLRRSRMAVVPGLLTTLLFLPQFSAAQIAHSLTDTGKQSVLALVREIRGIDEQNLFALGWFQSPQVMLLSNKRFQDYTNTQKLMKAKEEKREIYLVTTNESFLLKDEIGKILQSCEVAKTYGKNGLYRIIY